MDTNKHDLLSGDILLMSGEGAEAYKRIFHITKCVSSKGSSAICYEAYYGDATQQTGGGIGVLKEFYPRAFVDELTRRSDGQLILQHPGNARGDAFIKEKKKYLKPYERLLKLKFNGNKAGADDISTFIPHFEIYHGCNEEGKPIGTAYIWTPQPLLETFAEMCRDIHEHPSERPEFKLISVLNCLDALTRCVQILHDRGIVHCDINPNNFGFVKRKQEVLTQSAVLFDINSICNLYEKQGEVLGTEGYVDPWIERNGFKPDFPWDIYSIGACLFHAIIVCDQTKQTNFRYRPEFYDYLKHLVDESELIKASEYNRHPRLTYYLTRILKRCLYRPEYLFDEGEDNYYTQCEDLLEDLKQALRYVQPSGTPLFDRDRWQLVDSEKEWGTLKEKNSQLAMQYQLFDYPLYEWGQDSEETNMTVLGFGNYGQKFTDICLQVGQIEDKPLHISVFSNDIGMDRDGRVSDKDIYLEARPALKQFFKIDDAYNEKGECYGHISFHRAELEGDDSQTVRGLENCIGGSAPGPQYIFIALGNDETNIMVAKACRAMTDRLRISCCICYACEDKNKDSLKLKDVYPIYVSTTAEERPSFDEIERMAFNAHLVWETNQNLSFDDIRNKFLDPYNHDSNVSYVLNLKYFLHQAKIEMPKIEALTMEACVKTAARVQKAIENDRVKRKLAYCEHKRWNIEKLTQGWQPLEDLERCAYQGTKDKNAKLHACICRSDPRYTLDQIFKDRSEWDDPKARQNPKLDELDRLTVTVHQVYLEAAQRVKQENHLSGEAINGIRVLAERQENVYAAFLGWYSCLAKIWNGDRSQASQYESLKKAFLDAASSMDNVTKAAINSQTGAFESAIKPVLSSMEYRDEKSKDFLLVEYLPYILTNDPSTCLIVPCDMDVEKSFDMTEIFENISVATMIDPAKLVLLFSLENKQAPELCKQGLTWICAYMKSKNLRAEIDLLLTFPEEMSTLITQEAIDELKLLGHGRIRKLSVIYRTENLLSALAGYQQNFRRCLLEKNGDRFMGMLDDAKVYETIPYYSQDAESADLKFTVLKNSEYLSYIQNVKKAQHHLFLRVTDMPIRRKVTRDGASQPEFYHDYEMLWEKYRTSQNEWEYMTGMLADYCRTHDVMAVLRLPTKAKPLSVVSAPYIYKLPTYCVASARMLLDKLTDFGVIGRESHIKVDTTRSYELRIYDMIGCRDVYDELIAGLFRMSPTQTLEIIKDPVSGTVTVRSDHPEVVDLKMDESRMDDLYALLCFFKDHGYILRLNRNCGKISFIFATSQIKSLMSERYRILEVYLYHKIKSSDMFDDVISGKEIDWEKSGFKKSPGFSYVITKGFSTLFLGFEGLCGGADAYPEQKVALRQCGIHATAVYIADSLNDGNRAGKVSKDTTKKTEHPSSAMILQKSLEIDKIGETLCGIIQGSYDPK